ncbi:hypothetical protein C2845_PM03G08550 [Panicum miliaceum]|uniref:AAA+ ATPase domain-containing protein n=1 Tax=Panicum miliaceum TaxID=4540 RepID=A0A3L6T9T6_PANMI|nr:hypothetical protein C2845_PM03G08550 [Panicum miliaceum]
MDLSTVMASPSYAKAADAYKKAVATAATVTAYTVLARGMARELVPDGLRSAARWAVSAVGDLLMPPPKPRRIKTILIGRYGEESHAENRLFWDARAYLAARIDPTAMSRLCLTFRDDSQMLSMLPGDSVADVFEGVEFTWTLIAARSGPPCTLVLSFDAEKTEVALHRYVPFIVMKMEGARRQERWLKIFMNEQLSWEGINHQHPATFDTVAMDPALKQSIIADIDRFLKRRDYYQRIGKAWKRGYLLYGPPGTGKSSLVAAIANYLCFNLYDLDLSRVSSNKGLQKLLTAMPNKSILVIEDIDCCFSTKSRDGTNTKQRTNYGDGDSDSDSESDGLPPPPRTNSSYERQRRIALSGLLNFIDGLWSTSGEERIIVFTTNYKDRLDPALLRPGRMDMHIYMGCCGWEAFKTLARNYFLLDDHELFPEIQELLSAVEVTPAEATEMLLRSEDVDVALQGFVEFLQDKKKQGRRRSKK